MLKSFIRQSNPENQPAEQVAAVPHQFSNPIPSAASSHQVVGQTHQAPMSNILAKTVQIVGDLKFGQELMVDGYIKGNVTSEQGTLTIGENGVILGEIRTRSAIVFGKVEGNLVAKELCDLRATSEFSGDVVASRLAMEEGAVFMGAWKVGPR